MASAHNAGMRPGRVRLPGGLVGRHGRWTGDIARGAPLCGAARCWPATTCCTGKGRHSYATAWRVHVHGFVGADKTGGHGRGVSLSKCKGGPCACMHCPASIKSAPGLSKRSSVLPAIVKAQAVGPALAGHWAPSSPQQRAETPVHATAGAGTGERLLTPDCLTAESSHTAAHPRSGLCQHRLEGFCPVRVGRRGQLLNNSSSCPWPRPSCEPGS